MIKIIIIEHTQTKDRRKRIMNCQKYDAPLSKTINFKITPDIYTRVSKLRKTVNFAELMREQTEQLCDRYGF